MKKDKIREENALVREENAFYSLAGFISGIPDFDGKWKLFESVTLNFKRGSSEEASKLINEYSLCLAMNSSEEEGCIEIRNRLLKHIMQKNSE